MHRIADCISVPRRPNCVWWRSGSTPRSKAAKKNHLVPGKELLRRSRRCGHAGRNATQGLGDGAPACASSGPCAAGGTAQRRVEMANPSLLAEGRYLCPLPWAGGGNSPSLVLTDVTTCLTKRARLQKRRVLSIFASQWHHEAPAKSKPNTLCWISCTGWPQLCIENRERQQRRGKFLFQGH